MSLWKRTLMGTAMVTGTAIVVAAASHLPPGVVPPVSTVLAVVAAPIVVVGGTSLLRLWRQTAVPEPAEPGVERVHPLAVGIEPR